ncbi:MAG: O-antigen ligase family protein [Candidatus Dormibacteraceae bacterium]
MRPHLERLGAFLPAAVALALPTLYIPIAVDSFILPRAAIVVAAACIGAGVALLTPGGPRLGALRWPLVAAAAAAIVATLFSISPALSVAGSYTRYESLPVRLAYLGLLAFPVWLIRGETARRFVAPAFVFGTSVACLEALGQWAGHVPFRPDGNLGNANLLAALVAMAFPVAVARGLRGGNLVVAWWLAIAVMIATLVVVTSRSGALGALVGTLALAVCAARGRWRRATLGGSAAVLAFAGLVVLRSPLSTLNDDPLSLRLHLWQDGLRMIIARPITGWGLDTTGLAFGRFLSSDYASLVTFDRIHSGPLDIAATQGVLGLAALGWVVCLTLRGGWRNRFKGDAAALTAALVGYSVWVLANFDWAPATGAFWLLCGTAWSAVRAAETGSAGQTDVLAAAAGSTWWRSGLAVGLGLAALPLGALPMLADIWYSQNRADLAVRVDPLQARYHWSLGEGLVALGDTQRGVAEMQRAAELGETEPSLYVELGDTQLKLGRKSQARDDYGQALAIDPFYTPASQRLASLGS